MIVNVVVLLVMELFIRFTINLIDITYQVIQWMGTK